MDIKQIRRRQVQRPTIPYKASRRSFGENYISTPRGLFLTRASFVNKRRGVRHQAIKELFYEAVIIMPRTSRGYDDQMGPPDKSRMKIMQLLS